MLVSYPAQFSCLAHLSVNPSVSPSVPSPPLFPLLPGA